MLQLRNDVYQIMKELQICTFSTIGEDGNPRGRYVFAQADKDLNIRFASCKTSRKVMDIQQNPNVHINCGVQEMNDLLKPYLQIEGIAELQQSEEERKQFWNASLESIYTGPEDPNYVVIKVIPSKIEIVSIAEQSTKILNLVDLQNSNKEYFDANATQWNGMRSEFFPSTIRSFAADKLDVKANEIAADIGAGSGFITQELLDRGLKVFSIDHSEKMLEEIQKNLRDKGDVTTLPGDAESLPLSNEAVNYAFANMFLHHVQNPLNTIKEMVRIVKPGGKVCITDLDTHTFDFLVEEHHDRWMGFERTDIQEWFKKAGLENIEIDCIPGSCKADSESCSDSADISIFCATGVKK